MINLNSSSNNSMTDDETDPMKTESDNSITDYSTGLPSIEDLTPLSQSLIPFQLASAFKITQETPRTMSDVTKASNSTFSSLNFNNSTNNNNNNNQPGPVNPPDPKRIRPGSDEDDTVLNEDQQQQQQGGNSSSKNSAKRPRLVWTPQLHKRFVEVVAHLGLKNAVPKTIMQLMNVEGLTRENVASHLQKYRLYVKRMQENDDDLGANNNINSSNHSDNLFASTPIPRFNESYSGQGNNTNTNNNSSSNNNVNSGHAEIGMPGMGFYDGGGGGNNSLHHHHHYHHHYQQQQYGGGGGGNMGQQQNNYGSNAFTTHHHLAQK